MRQIIFVFLAAVAAAASRRDDFGEEWDDWKSIHRKKYRCRRHNLFWRTLL